jgi:hypothetical protein
MTIAELIALLDRLPPDLRVLVEGYENGGEDVQRLERHACVNQGDRPWWEGPWQDDPAGESCLLLAGERRRRMEPRPSALEPQ